MPQAPRNAVLVPESDLAAGSIVQAHLDTLAKNAMVLTMVKNKLFDKIYQLLQALCYQSAQASK